jgi:hypothetical protein
MREAGKNVLKTVATLAVGGAAGAGTYGIIGGVGLVPWALELV